MEGSSKTPSDELDLPILISTIKSELEEEASVGAMAGSSKTPSDGLGLPIAIGAIKSEQEEEASVGAMARSSTTPSDELLLPIGAIKSEPDEESSIGAMAGSSTTPSDELVLQIGAIKIEDEEVAVDPLKQADLHDNKETDNTSLGAAYVPLAGIAFKPEEGDILIQTAEWAGFGRCLKCKKKVEVETMVLCQCGYFICIQCFLDACYCMRGQGEAKESIPLESYVASGSSSGMVDLDGTPIELECHFFKPPPEKNKKKK